MREIGKGREENAEVECEQHQPRGHDLREHTGPDGVGQRLAGLTKVHVERNQHVVVERDDAGENADQRKPEEDRSLCEQGGKDHQFADETDGRRQADERDQKDGHGRPGQRHSPAEPPVVLDVFAPGLVGDDDGDQKCAEIHQEIGEHVEKRGLGAELVHDDDAEQNVTGVSDRGVGKQPFDVRLPESHDVAVDHRCYREDHQQEQPFRAGRKGLRTASVGYGDIEKADQKRETRRLGCNGEKSRNGNGRAFVDIRTPEVEGHRSDLVADAGENHDRGRHEGHGIVSPLAQSPADLDNVGLSGQTVDDGKAVDHQAG